MAVDSSQRQWSSLILHGYEDELERIRPFKQGGFQPIHLNDSLHNRYRVIHQLGYGGFSTVWLCQDTQHDSPKYVAVKVLVAREVEADCCELRMTRCLRELAIHQEPGGEHICLQIDDFRLTGSNGTHICIVYPVLGPGVGSVMGILSEELKPNEGADRVRKLASQATEGLAAIHHQGTCQGDLRPLNILIQLRTLDGLDESEVYDLLGEPEKAEALLRNSSDDRIFDIEKPRCLVYPVDYDLLELSHLGEDVYVSDFGESFDTRVQPLRLTEILRPDCAPEMVLERSGGVAADLWSLGCLLFEVRLGEKVIFPR